MTIWKAVKAFAGLSEFDNEENFKKGLEQTSPPLSSVRPISKPEPTRTKAPTLEILQTGYSAKKKGGMEREIKIKTPLAFEDAQDIANYIRECYPVIVNFKSLDTETSRKLSAFLSGTAYALNAQVQKLNGQMVLFAPTDMPIQCDSSASDNVFSNYQQETNIFEEQPKSAPIFEEELQPEFSRYSIS